MNLVKFLTTINEADPSFAAELPNIISAPQGAYQKLNPGKPFPSIQQHMRNHGYNEVGSGGYSRVFEPQGGGNHIVKVFHTAAMAPGALGRETGEEDFDQYNDFLCSVKWLRLSAKETNPHFPNVHKVGTYEYPEESEYGGKSATAFYAVMEKLEPYDFDSLEVPYEMGTEDWTRYMSALAVYELLPWHPHRFLNIFERAVDNLPEMQGVSTIGWDEWEIYMRVCRENRNIPICDAMSKIFEFMALVGCHRDFKPANAMMRGGVTVFTDPVEG